MSATVVRFPDHRSKPIRNALSLWRMDRPEALRQLLQHAVDSPTLDAFRRCATALGVPQSAADKAERLRQILSEAVPAEALA